ncbi:MAG: peroxidase-related enzyme [Alphaproteobacteria bacterium]|nr:peroxidase-related enzyme [Alphaproteobacteria bacterium]
MPFFPSLPEDAGVRKIWETFNPEAQRGLSIFSRSFMRKEGMLSPADREMIAAFTSELNDSDYCFIGHSRAAVKLGADEAVFEPLLQDIETAPVREEMKPLLAFVRKLTLTPARVTQADVDAVFAAGWDEQSVHEAICVCARFSMMNRLTLGHGLIPKAENADARAENMDYGKAD